MPRAEAILGTAGSVHEGGLRGGQADPFGYAVAIFLGLVIQAVAAVEPR